MSTEPAIDAGTRTSSPGSATRRARVAGWLFVVEGVLFAARAVDLSLEIRRQDQLFRELGASARPDRGPLIAALPLLGISGLVEIAFLRSASAGRMSMPTKVVAMVGVVVNLGVFAGGISSFLGADSRSEAVFLLGGSLCVLVPTLAAIGALRSARARRP
jgi:hypothetical protein